ncbi:hypothetical protein ACQEVZ_06090 [Dactylosporangium sp. CA-152071]|uniref:hypothetical protein n=1 Tax=Dactylosporangium sp. CA-152071 TaxID=3239933 RepID=UPI003D8D469D
MERFIDRMMAMLVVFVLATGAVVVIDENPAAAAGTCGTQGNYFDGYYYDPDIWPGYSFEGASGYIVVRDGVLCSGAGGIGNFSNAWLMIAGWNRTGAAWSQVGFERTSGSPLRWFSQHAWNNSTGDHLSTRYSTFSIASEVGVRHTFRVLWNSACTCLQAIIDVTVWSNSDFNPFFSSGWGGLPFSPQFSGETGHLETDVPGRSGTRTAFTALGAQQYSNDALVPMPCAMNATTSSARWGRSASGCDAFSIWTATP